MTFMRRCGVVLSFVFALQLHTGVAFAHGRSPSHAERAAREMYERGTRTSARYASLLGWARQYHDTRRVRCLDGGLSQVNSQLRLFQVRLTRMEAAWQHGDEANFRREAEAIRLVSQAIMEVETNTSSCIAGDQPVARDGMTRVEMVIDPRAPRASAVADSSRRDMAPSVN